MGQIERVHGARVVCVCGLCTGVDDDGGEVALLEDAVQLHGTVHLGGVRGGIENV